MKKSTLIVLLLLGILILLFVSGASLYGYLLNSADLSDLSDLSGDTDISYGDIDFSFYDADGNLFRLSDFYGHPVVLNLWASWCGPCQYEMPVFQKYYDTEENVTFIMLNQCDGRRETVAKASQFVGKNNYTFPVYFDMKSESMIALDTIYLPTTVFINADGEIVAVHTGLIYENQFVSFLEQIKEE